MTNCGLNSENKVGTCCNKAYTNVNSATGCLNKTVDGNGTTADERLLLMAFVYKDVEANQKLGWGMIKDADIVNTAKRNYALVILDANQYKEHFDSCTTHKNVDLKKYEGKTFFVIANQALYIINDWTSDDPKEDIIYKLGIGSGP